CMQNVQLPLTF
nr:immunoglobulin light chain junction region [Macaca mulatta]